MRSNILVHNFTISDEFRTDLDIVYSYALDDARAYAMFAAHAGSDLRIIDVKLVRVELIGNIREFHYSCTYEDAAHDVE